MHALRTLALLLTVGVVLAVVLGYASLPEMLPLARAVTAPRSPLVAVRIPAINLLSLALVELLGRALRRTSRVDDARRVSAAAYLTVGVKAALEGVELFTFPAASSVLAPALMLVVCVGLCAAGWLGRVFVQQRETLAFTPREKGLAAVVSVVIVALEVGPFVLRG